MFVPWEKKKEKIPPAAAAWRRDCRGKRRSPETSGVTNVSPQAKDGDGWDWGGGH